MYQLGPPVFRPGSSNRRPHNRLSLTCFSRTHILTSVWKSFLLLATFSAAIFANAVPQDPLPMIATLCLPDASGEAGRDGAGDEGRVTAGVVTVDEGPWSAGENANWGSALGEEAEDDMVYVCMCVYVCVGSVLCCAVLCLMLNVAKTFV
jgi:hypothetical protein